MHGLDLNGFRSRTAHPNKQVMFYLTIKSAGSTSNPRRNRSAITRCFSCRFCGSVVLFVSSFPFCRRSRSLRGPLSAYAIQSSSNRAISRSKAERTPYLGWQLLWWARSPVVSHPFVADGVAHGGRADAHGDGCVGPAAVASHVSPWPQPARRGSQWPPELPPPTPGRSARDRRSQAASARARGRDKARSARAAFRVLRSGQRAVYPGWSSSAPAGVAGGRWSCRLGWRWRRGGRRIFLSLNEKQWFAARAIATAKANRPCARFAPRADCTHHGRALPFPLQTAGETRSPRRISALGDGLFVPSASRP